MLNIEKFIVDYGLFVEGLVLLVVLGFDSVDVEVVGVIGVVKVLFKFWNLVGFDLIGEEIILF